MKTKRGIGLIGLAVLMAACGEQAETITDAMPETDTSPVSGNNQSVEKVDESTTYQYTGTAQTIDGRRALIWEFADSEAFYLDEDTIQAWPAEMEGKEITIDGILIQNPGEKSVIKYWQIID